MDKVKISKPKTVKANDKSVLDYKREVQKIVRPIIIEQEKQRIYAYQQAHIRVI
jgi:hypothetical protein